MENNKGPFSQEECLTIYKKIKSLIHESKSSNTDQQYQCFSDSIYPFVTETVVTKSHANGISSTKFNYSDYLSIIHLLEGPSTCIIVFIYHQTDEHTLGNYLISEKYYQELKNIEKHKNIVDFLFVSMLMSHHLASTLFVKRGNATIVKWMIQGFAHYRKLDAISVNRKNDLPWDWEAFFTPNRFEYAQWAIEHAYELKHKVISKIVHLNELDFTHFEDAELLLNNMWQVVENYHLDKTSQRSSLKYINNSKIQQALLSHSFCHAAEHGDFDIFNEIIQNHWPIVSANKYWVLNWIIQHKGHEKSLDLLLAKIFLSTENAPNLNLLDRVYKELFYKKKLGSLKIFLNHCFLPYRKEQVEKLELELQQTEDKLITQINNSSPLTNIYSNKTSSNSKKGKLNPEPFSMRKKLKITDSFTDEGGQKTKQKKIIN